LVVPATTGRDAFPPMGNDQHGTSLNWPLDAVLTTSCKELAGLWRVPALR